MGIVGGIVGVNGAKTRAHVISLDYIYIFVSTEPVGEGGGVLPYLTRRDVPLNGTFSEKSYTQKKSKLIYNEQNDKLGWE